MRVLLGKPISSGTLRKTLLNKKIALPAFSSQTLSTVAYAPDKMLLTLGLAGAVTLQESFWLGFAVVATLVVIIAAYRENIFAYSGSGGDYRIARENLGPQAGVMVGAALLVDYILTVAISISAGVVYFCSLFSDLYEYKVEIALMAVAFLVLINIRGTGRVGKLVAIPTYIFIGVLGLLILAGLCQDLSGVLEPAYSSHYHYNYPDNIKIGLFGVAGGLLIVRAFAAGCLCLTGVETISSSVSAFEKPKSKNAASMLRTLGLITVSMLFGVLYLAYRTGIKIWHPDVKIEINGNYVYGREIPPLIGQLAETIFGSESVFFYIVLISAAIVLILAANTAFMAFPQLASHLSHDSFLPRQLYRRGDRLSHSNGILVVGVAAALLLLIYQANALALLEMYIVGLSLSFLISQLGMLIHWNRLLRSMSDLDSRKQARKSRRVNLAGLCVSFGIFSAVLISKFFTGAWVAVALMGIIYLLMQLIHYHYQGIEKRLKVSDWSAARALPARVQGLVLVSGLSHPAMRAISYARASNASSLSLVSVEIERKDTEELMRQWRRAGLDVPLTVLASPYRDITAPVIQYVRSIRRRYPRDLVTVYIPYYIMRHFWQRMLHNHSASSLHRQLQRIPGVIVVMVPWNYGGEKRLTLWKNSSKPLAAPEQTKGLQGSKRSVYDPERQPLQGEDLNKKAFQGQKSFGFWSGSDRNR